jgi:hypothetical protein
MVTRTALWLAVATGAVCAGCASKIERPVAEMSRARTLIEQAEKAGAQQYAAAELDEARDRLQLATDAVDEGENSVARARAVEAATGAELASALAARGEAEESAQKLAAGLEALRREASRSSEL